MFNFKWPPLLKSISNTLRKKSISNKSEGRLNPKLIQPKDKFFVEKGARLMTALITACQGKMNLLRMFSARELAAATNNWDDNHFHVTGAFSLVYRGTHDGRSIAVKVFWDGAFDLFINEAVTLAQINHRNVVRLLGYCIETQAPILVFEFLPYGSLYDYVHGKDPARRLPWGHRLRIATEVADALAYLHLARHRPIVHRNIQASAILLDEHLGAKVATFGFSGLIPDGDGKEQKYAGFDSDAADERHYILGPSETSTDVNAFGFVLVELLTGAKTLGPMGLDLVDHFLSSWETDLESILDAGVVREGKTEQLMACAKLAAECLQVSYGEKPTMREAVQELRRIGRP